MSGIRHGQSVTRPYSRRMSILADFQHSQSRGRRRPLATMEAQKLRGELAYIGTFCGDERSDGFGSLQREAGSECFTDFVLP